MRITHKVEQDICIISFNRELAMDEIHEAEEYVFKLLDNSEFEGAILNFKRVGYVDSSGVAFILSVSNLLKNENKHLALCELGHDLKEILVGLAIDRFLPLFETETEAITGIKQINTKQ